MAQELLQQGHLLACCPMHVTEVYTGLRAREETRTLHLFESLQHYSITWPVARLAGELKRDYGRTCIRCRRDRPR